jgi:predicted aldo/keto reductase-like oxidoreductase
MILRTRRDFIKTTVAGAGLALAARGAAQAAGTTAATDSVTVGKTGVKVSFLAQGTGFNGWARQSDHTRMGQESFSRLIRHSLDEGVRLMDMADLYGTHPFLKKAFQEIPREKYVLLSKIWPRKEDWVTPSSDGTEEIDRFRRELGVETIDICLLHCMLNEKWPQELERMRDGLSKMKEKGTVRAVGVSCHNHGALQTAASHPWVDVIFARINNKGGSEYSMDGIVEEISETLKTARRNGKFVVGMKLFGAGKLVKPEEKMASLSYVIGNELVDAMTIGMLNTEQVDDTIRCINQAMKS